MKEKYSKTLLLFVLILPLSYSSVFCQSGLIETVYFKSNSYTIEEKYKPALDSLAMKMSTDAFRYIKVFGFADTTGSDNYNDDLSGKRANAVYNYLAARVKIDSTKVYVTWIGKSGQDVAYDLHFPGAHIQQRCVDVWVTF